ncbi:MAG: HlyD family efflux transporter periplasmic adaptor subunit, partial [Pirellulaceae bacterium]|nr:HlyD family efflux transporter periplasmic adaptor subunit [Pirellulaceae bacterium]
MKNLGWWLELLLVIGLGSATERLVAQQIPTEVVAVDESALTLFSQDLQLSASTPGLLMTLQVTEGDIVEKDAVLAQLDWREAQLRLALAKHRHAAAVKRSESMVELGLAEDALRFAQKNKNRNDQLPEKAISVTERDQADFEYQRAIRTEQQAKENQLLNAIEVDVLQNEILVAEHWLSILSIQSPVEGVVAAIYKRPGEYVQAGEPVARVVKNDVLRVSALVTLNDAERIERGAAVRFIVSKTDEHQQEARIYQGRVISVSPENQREDRSSVPVLAEIENPGRILK